MRTEKKFSGAHGWLQFQFHWRNDADLVAGLPRYATTETDREVAAVTAETAPEGGVRRGRSVMSQLCFMDLRISPVDHYVSPSRAARRRAQRAAGGFATPRHRCAP